MGGITVLIADDHAVLRSGLNALLSAHPEIEVVAEAGDGKEAVAKASEVHPDIVLMDITMPELNGVDATRAIKEADSTVKILVLTMHEDVNYLRKAIAAGADGFIPKKAADTELLAAIKAVYEGEHYLHHSMSSVLISEMRDDTEGESEKQNENGVLSGREMSVLKLLAAGYTNQQAADKLFLSVKTIESYKARLRAKLQLNSRVDMIKYAINAGLLDPEL